MDHVSETIAEIIGAIGPAMLALGTTSKPSASADEQLRAIEAVKRLTGDQVIQLNFRSRDQEPRCSDDEPLILDTYVDDQGNEYWIEPHGGTVVQMGPESGRYSPSHTTRSEGGLSVQQLREHAIEIAERQMTGFRQMLSTLHPLEANDRRAVYFFRWEDLSEPLLETELPPFVQVGLYADGKIASFADTLSSYRDGLPPGSDHITDLPNSWSKTH
ncbi:MAG: hypothetical protein V1738_00525 [Patescibacteria group bacterium]